MWRINCSCAAAVALFFLASSVESFRNLLRTKWDKHVSEESELEGEGVLCSMFGGNMNPEGDHKSCWSECGALCDDRVLNPMYLADYHLEPSGRQKKCVRLFNKKSDFRHECTVVPGASTLAAFFVQGDTAGTAAAAAPTAPPAPTPGGVQARGVPPMEGQTFARGVPPMEGQTFARGVPPMQGMLMPPPAGAVGVPPQAYGAHPVPMPNENDHWMIPQAPHQPHHDHVWSSILLWAGVVICALIVALALVCCVCFCVRTAPHHHH